MAAIRQLVEGYGVSTVELGLDLGVIYPEVFDASFYTTVADLQQELGFTCTVHLPFLWIDPASLNEPVRQASVDSLHRAVELTRPLDVFTYVLHLMGTTTIEVAVLLSSSPHFQAIAAALMLQAGRSLETVCGLLDPQSICVENLEAPPFEAVWPVVEQYGVSVCLDVGHLAHQGGGELEFLAQYADRIGEVHLHDATSTTAAGRLIVHDHLPLGQGTIDYKAFLQALDETGYTGAVILENNSKQDLEASLEQIGDYL